MRADSWVVRIFTTICSVMKSGEEKADSTEVECIQRPSRQKSAVNLLLILACVVFGAASFMFGYDDKVISPIIALPAFVSRLNITQTEHGQADPFFRLKSSRE
ncbi:hypothetical protein N7468_001890 [Penicillium chermesinum]|uniref:Uncharacterized protein n=1 Tax=Penicillium chermesinum TaxID=63820 RepID=A0A9W9TXH4_9EURO|nr:uncharacterized protein N7468_001890 [Penicillium chermesinum]KAJ5246907.1 hypothetical protein N7468_001890 [Penicillium chermesinum]